MTMDSDSYGEMHRRPFRDTPFSDDTADRLLSGRLPALDAPEPYRGLASLFEAASGAPTHGETAQKATVVAAAMAAMEAASPVHSAATAPLSRRRSMLSKLLTAKAAAAATVAVLGLGTAAAAATGALPIGTANSHADAGLAIATSNSSGTNNGSNGHSKNSGANSTGAASNQHAQFGLCTAFLAHHPASVSPATSVPSDKSKTFSALISSHGGLAGTSTYCQTVVSTTTTTAGSGDSADTNGTENQGKPADAGKPSSTPPVSTPNSGGTGTADTASGGSSSTGTGAAGSSSSGASSSGSGNSAGH